MKKKQLLSICIPTYNRAGFLKQCLEALIMQVGDNHLAEEVEVIILDNHSSDETQLVVRDCSKKFKSIRYIKNNTNIGPIKNVFRVREFAKGQHTWILSDDDIINKGAVAKVIDVLRTVEPDVLYLNLSTYTKDLNHITKKNVLKINHNLFFNGKKELFKFLASYFPDIFTIDWYTTFLSNLIFRTSIVYKFKSVKEDYLKNLLGYFPHFCEILLTPQNYSFYILAQPLVKYRENNGAYSDKTHENYLFITQIFSFHYLKILSENKKYMNLKFHFFVYMKLLFMRIRYMFRRFLL
jgi:glycosyltransferase involved in cell wall biosynthesis